MDSISSTLLHFSPRCCKTNRTAPVNTCHIICCTSTQDFFSSEGPGYLGNTRQEDRQSHRFIERCFCFVPTDPLYQPPSIPHLTGALPCPRQSMSARRCTPRPSHLPPAPARRLGLKFNLPGAFGGHFIQLFLQFTWQRGSTGSCLTEWALHPV